MRWAKYFSLLVISLVLVAVLQVPQQAWARAYTAERYDAQIEIMGDNQMRVRETVTFRFEGGPYTYAFRQLTLDQLENAIIESASLDGEALPQGTQPGQVEIRRQSNQIDVTWHFAPTSDASHTLDLVYLVEGHIHWRQNDEGIYWQAIPEEHEYPIQQARIRVLYPANLSPVEKPQLRGASYTVNQQPGQLEFNAQDIPANQGVVIEVRFPRGSLIAHPPQWQAAVLARGDQARRAAPWAIGLALGVGGLGTLALIGYRRRHRAESIIIPPGIITNPPDDLSPAQAAFLLSPAQMGSGVPAATLVHLAQSGWLNIEEQPGGKGLFKARDYRVHRRQGHTPLKEHEQVLYQHLFSSRSGQQDAVRLSSLANRFVAASQPFRKAIIHELTSAGLLDARQIQRRTRLNMLGVTLLVFETVLLVLGLLLGFGSTQLAWLGTLLLGLAGGIFILGVAAVIIASGWPVLTQQGEARAARWLGFKQHLASLLKGRSPLHADWLEPYLPFAVAFGLGLQWVEGFRNQGFAPAIRWLMTASGEGGINDLLGVIAATNVITSSGDAGAGGGAGGGGGGASGAG